MGKNKNVFKEADVFRLFVFLAKRKWCGYASLDEEGRRTYLPIMKVRMTPRTLGNVIRLRFCTLLTTLPLFCGGDWAREIEEEWWEGERKTMPAEACFMDPQLIRLNKAFYFGPSCPLLTGILSCGNLAYTGYWNPSSSSFLSRELHVMGLRSSLIISFP